MQDTIVFLKEIIIKTIWQTKLFVTTNSARITFNLLFEKNRFKIISLYLFHTFTDTAFFLQPGDLSFNHADSLGTRQSVLQTLTAVQQLQQLTHHLILSLKYEDNKH